MNLALTTGQKAALDAIVATSRALPGKPAICTITGPAGTGKTTLLSLLPDVISGSFKVLAPTGRAALRVHEATGGRVPATTVHRWLYIPLGDGPDVRFLPKLPEALEIPSSRLVVVDDASPLGLTVWRHLLTACTQAGLNIVLIGDPFQLPPVEPRGAEAFDVLAQPALRRVNLTEILRQAQDSPIIRAATHVREGDVRRGLSELQNVGRDRLLDTMGDVIDQDGVILCHRNETRHTINAALRRLYGLEDRPLAPSEPLLVLKNTYRLNRYNGEVVPFGRWTGVDARVSVAGESIHYAQIRVGNDDAIVALDEIFGRTQLPAGTIASHGAAWARSRQKDPPPYLSCNLGYALTCHRAQGSEWDSVVVLLDRIDTREEGRRWLYTAITRAAKTVYWHVGEKYALRSAKRRSWTRKGAPLRVLVAGPGAPVAATAIERKTAGAVVGVPIALDGDGDNAPGGYDGLVRCGLDVYLRLNEAFIAAGKRVFLWDAANEVFVET